MPHILPRQLNNSTPCTDWSLQQLLGHVVYELLWVPDIVNGKTMAEVGDKYEGDVLGDDLLVAWDNAANKASAAVKQADLSATAHLSYGDTKMEAYITEVGCDMLVHGWDVAQAVNCTLHMDKKLAQFAYFYYLPRADRARLSGVFGAAIDVSSDSIIQVKLLALLGRKA